MEWEKLVDVSAEKFQIFKVGQVFTNRLDITDCKKKAEKLEGALMWM